MLPLHTANCTGSHIYSFIDTLPPLYDISVLNAKESTVFLILFYRFAGIVAQTFFLPKF
jgi:hypothetical protein